MKGILTFMMKEEKKFVPSPIFEGMTSIRALIRGRDAGTSDRTIHEILYDGEREKKLMPDLRYLKAISDKHGFALRKTTAEEIDSLSLGSSHGGIIAICSDRTFPRLSKAAGEIKEKGFYVMIEGIEDPYNFGYALRSLYAAGVDGIILSERNWMSAAGVVARASAGASEMFRIFISDPIEAADCFHERAYQIVCADIRTEHLLEDTEILFPVFLIVGGERRGISRALLDRADLKVRISYGREFRASLSAASAATILGYEIFRQNREK
jgi:23S rRNA (guanosine2251-2'-O)-methyltransferase